MQDLFRKYLNNRCSPEEVRALLAYFNIPENEEQLRKLITENLESVDVDDDGSRWSSLTDQSLAVIKKQINAEPGKVVSLYRRSWFQIAAAAVILIGGFAVFSMIHKPNQEQEIVQADGSKQEIAPGSSKAILTLADGSTINLENVDNGTITQQGSTKISKPAEGQLAYSSLNEKPTGVLFNSMSTPRGGQYQLMLSDGTKVWLNAASSIRFPAAFTGSERKVELSGEAYFEVAKNVAMPFKVAVSGKGEVEVLGTHFNVNAYTDEATVSTTLLEGSVKVVALGSNESQIIAAGEQAQLNTNGQISINKIDADEAVAWKNGTFNFNNADLPMVLRQVSRWYDLEIVFEGSVPQRQFSGEIQRDLKLSQVLKLLERNNVFSRVEGKKLIVLKAKA